MALARAMSSILLLALWLAAATGTARAHEVQPAVSDVLIGQDRVQISIIMTLEAPLAGLDLFGLSNTNDSSESDRYDELRALPPDALEARFREFWPAMASRITLRAGETELAPELDGLTVPPVGEPGVARFSTLRLSAALPDDGSPVVFGWARSLGAIIVRQTGVEDGYTGFLQGGDLSDPMPREGGVETTKTSVFLTYIVSGFEHIIPAGLDHILFVLGLFFLSLKLGALLWQVSAFTLAHTVTLALGSLGIVTIPATIVEPLIAASIVYVGVENVLSKGLTPWRPVVVFLFGLLHGLGFASVLGVVGLPPGDFVVGLIGFNIGVEFGQLAVIALAFLAVGLWFGKKPWYRARIANPASLAISAVGAWWVVERTLL